ncbi:MAG: FliA/WhiG family RNA polymerase sigma factor [Acidobacteriota bacterium]
MAQLLQPVDTIASARLTPEEREGLILQCMPVVYAIARRMIASLGADVALEDLVSAGTVGLIHAVDNFEPAQDVKLQTYAAHRIRGAMLDNLRENDWFPRRQRGHLKRMQEAMSAAQAKHQSFQVSDDDVAAELGVSVDQYRETMASLPVTRVVSLEETTQDSDNSFEPSCGEDPSEILERAEIAKLLESALGRLPQEEQSVLGLYYEQEMTPQEITTITKLPVKRVYQLKAQAILRLRSDLGRRLLRRTKT